MKKKLLVDLFAGAGDLSCGLEMAGFSPILANEIDPNYADTYKRNHSNTEVVVDDIREVFDRSLKKKLGLKVGELDLLASKGVSSRAKGSALEQRGQFSQAKGSVLALGSKGVSSRIVAVEAK